MLTDRFESISRPTCLLIDINCTKGNGQKLSKLTKNLLFFEKCAYLEYTLSLEYDTFSDKRFFYNKWVWGGGATVIMFIVGAILWAFVDYFYLFI